MRSSTWQHWVNLLLGVWVIISAYVNFTSFSLATNLTITGIIIAILAIWGGLENNMANTNTRTTRHA